MFAILSFVAGAFIAIQAGINSQLGVMLKNSIFATVVAFIVSAFISLVGMLVFSKSIPASEVVKDIPLHLWFGGVLSAIGVGLFYFLIPKMGVGPMMSMALTGQMLMAVIASHFGWFGMPANPISAVKVLGVISMLLGIVLINR